MACQIPCPNLRRNRFIPLCVSLLVSGFLVSGVLFGEGYIGKAHPDHGALLDQLEGAMALIGVVPRDLFERLGPPDELYPLRGASAAEDDVLCVYSDGLAVYIYDNRVWQLQTGGWAALNHDSGAVGTAEGEPLLSRYLEKLFRQGPLVPGLSRERTELLLGTPWYQDEESTVYLLPDRGFSLRLRLYFGHRGLEEIFLFRGDF